MKRVNLGCGKRYHPDWINIDMVATGPGVIVHDLSTGIPLEDRSCDIVYHAHVIEHIRREHVHQFLAECFRVLKPGGILRIATPNLEEIVRVYLDRLDRATAGDQAAGDDHRWITLEMYDQTVREVSGGGMLEYFKQQPIPNEDFVLRRVGEEARPLISSFREPQGAGQQESTAQRRLKRLATSPIEAVRGILRRLILTTEEKTALRVGQFRLGGEVHQWMYDRFSLTQILKKAGFVGAEQKTADQSGYGDWARYRLDAMPDGTPYKPDSIYMEAVRP